MPSRLVPIQPVILEEHLPARAVARILGVRVGTLAKWRYLKKGPHGWLHISATCVVYSASEVQRFLDERKAKGGDFR